MVDKEAILSMKWLNKQTRSCLNATRHVSRLPLGSKHNGMQWNVCTLLNIGMLLLLAAVVSGCGQSLASLSPIHPVQNISTALAEMEQNPSADVVIPAIPENSLAEPVYEEHGLETVGFRLVKGEAANTQNLTYLFAFADYVHSLDEWDEFLSDWSEVLPQIELAKENEDRKIVDTILVSDHPPAFEVHAKQPILTKTLDGITLSICYWRRTDLDRKYNRGNAFSPFYETEALRQGDKTDVFYVKITNNREQHIIFDVKSCNIEDQGENFYDGLDYEDLRERFTFMSRATGLYVTNGLKKAREILLEKRLPVVEKHVGSPRLGILPGESAEGFIPFRQVKLNAMDLVVTIPIEKAPPPEGAKRYQTIDFKFPFNHKRGIRVAQPAPQRY